MVYSYHLWPRTASHAPDEAMVQQLVGHNLVIVITEIGHLLLMNFFRRLVWSYIGVRIFVLDLGRALFG